MTCKLHIPSNYDPLSNEDRCECGAVRVPRKESAMYGALGRRRVTMSDTREMRPWNSSMPTYGRVKCENCSGTGTVHSHDPLCWICGGSGWLLPASISPDRLRELAERLEALPAYQPNTWGVMVEGDDDDPRFFPARVWVKREDVLRIVLRTLAGEDRR